MNNYTIADIIYAFSGINALVCFFGWKRFDKAFRIFGIYIFIALAIRFGMHLLWQKSLNNLWLIHIGTILEFTFFSLFFNSVYLGMKWFKEKFWIFMTLMIIMLIANSLFFEPIWEFNSIARAIIQIILIIYVIFYFFDAYGKVDFSYVTNQSLSLICFGILTYHSGSLFIFMSSQFFFEPKSKPYEVLWIVNDLLSFLFQILILIAILKISLYKAKNRTSI